jgi:hypothetical protein
MEFGRKLCLEGLGRLRRIANPIVPVAEYGCRSPLIPKLGNCIMMSDHLRPPTALPSRKFPLPTGLEAGLFSEPSRCGGKFKDSFLAGDMILVAHLVVKHYTDWTLCHENYRSGSTSSREYLDQQNHCQLLKKVSVP